MSAPAPTSLTKPHPSRRVAVSAFALAALLPIVGSRVNTARAGTVDGDGIADVCVQTADAGAPSVPLAAECRRFGRTVDQLTNPGFWATGAAHAPGTWPGPATMLSDSARQGSHYVPGAYVGDPYRLPWNWEGAGRGFRVEAQVPNRYGANLAVFLWFPNRIRPAAGAKPPMRLPVVIIGPGARGFQDTLRWAAQGLAEAGYLSVTVDPQDTGRSETCGTPTASDDCPGRPASRDFSPAGSATHVAAFEDVLAWLFSGPWSHYVDAERVGLAGHSLGGYAATVVGNRDTRISAVVAWDSNGSLAAPAFVPRTPTMFQNSETGELCPSMPVCPLTPAAPGAEAPGALGRDDHPAVRNAAPFVAAGIPVHEVVLADSTHNEWAYQIAPPGLSASSVGERVAMHYTLAWFDLWLQGFSRHDLGRAALHPRNAAVVDRLIGSEFDDSADSSAVGTGWWDPVAARNQPHTIGGDAVATRVSSVYRSQVFLGEVACADLAAGCT